MISWPIIFVADVLPFLAMPEAIRRWENILKDCRRILDNFPAGLSSNYISSNNFTIYWHIIFAANVLLFWGVPKAIQMWGNILKHCRRILDNFPASLASNYISSNNFTIYWHIIFVANVLPFWVVPKAIRMWENIVEHCRRILDNFPASIVAKYTSGSNFIISWHIIFLADVLPFWAVPDAIRRWETF